MRIQGKLTFLPMHLDWVEVEVNPHDLIKQAGEKGVQDLYNAILLRNYKPNWFMEKDVKKLKKNKNKMKTQTGSK